MPKSHDDPAKDRWREAWYQFIRKHRHSLRGSPKDWRVAFFPGEEALEVKVYDRLGIPRENLLGLEKRPKAYDELKKKSLGIGLTKEPMDALDFFQQTDEKFDIVNLDYEWTFNQLVIRTLKFLAGRQLLGESSLFGLTYYGKREKEDTKELHYETFLGTEMAVSFFTSDKNKLDILMDNDKSPLEILSSLGYETKNKVRDLWINTIKNIFSAGLQNLQINEVFRRNPNFLSIEERVREKVRNPHFEFESEVDIHNTSFAEILHISNLANHLLEMGFGRNKEDTVITSVMAQHYLIKPYLSEHVELYRYISRNRALMISNFINLRQYIKIIEKFRYLAEHAYIDLSLIDFVKSVLKKSEITKADVDKFNEIMRRNIGIMYSNYRVVKEINPSIYLGSSAKLPKLTEQLYFEQRYADEQQGIPAEKTWEGIKQSFKVEKAQLPKLEEQYLQGTYGPRPMIETKADASTKENKTLESIVKIDKFQIIPDQYWNRLKDHKQDFLQKRIMYFIEEDLRRVNLSQEQLDALVRNIHASDWYKQNDKQPLKEERAITFFDDILLMLIADKVPTTRDTKEIYSHITGNNWRDHTYLLNNQKSNEKPNEQNNYKNTAKKPMLDNAELYRKLSVDEGKTDEWILQHYDTPKDGSITAYKAWITIREQRQKTLQQKTQQKATDEDIGVKVIMMRREGKSKEEVKNELGLKEYQYRGIMAANRRGAYNEALAKLRINNPLPTYYVDEHGIVHPRNPKI